MSARRYAGNVGQSKTAPLLKDSEKTIAMPNPLTTYKQEKTKEFAEKCRGLDLRYGSEYQIAESFLSSALDGQVEVIREMVKKEINTWKEPEFEFNRAVKIQEWSAQVFKRLLSILTPNKQS